MSGAKQEPRPAYHRRMDLERLQQKALQLPVRVVDGGDAYEVRLLPGDAVIPPGQEAVLLRGRHEVVAAYLLGWTHARGLAGSE